MSDLADHKFHLRHHEDFFAPAGMFRLVKVVRSGDRKSGLTWDYYLIDDFDQLQQACERADTLTQEARNPKISFIVYDDQRRIVSR